MESSEMQKRVEEVGTIHPFSNPDSGLTISEKVVVTAIHNIRIQALRLGAETGRDDIKQKIDTELDLLLNTLFKEKS